MPRRTTRKRRPTEMDLTESQRRIYEVLSDELREEYLAQIPDIKLSNAGGQKKGEHFFCSPSPALRQEKEGALYPVTLFLLTTL